MIQRTKSSRYHVDLCSWPHLAISCLLKTSTLLISSTCILLIFVSSLLWLVHYPLIVFNTLPSKSFSSKLSLLTPSINFEAMLKFLLFVDSSGSRLLLKFSRSTRNQSIDLSSLCLLFSISSSLDDPSFLIRVDCNTLKMVTGKTIWHHENWGKNHVNNHSGGHEVTRNLSEPSDQTVIHIVVLRIT